jgi:hypothetical protein
MPIISGELRQEALRREDVASLNPGKALFLRQQLGLSY